MAVPALVLVADDGRDVGERVERARDPLADKWVPFDDRALGRLERAGLREDRLGDRDLADVVQRRGVAQPAQRGPVHAQPPADRLAQRGDRSLAGPGAGIAGVEQQRQRIGRAEVCPFEPLVGLGGVQRGAELVGDDLHEPRVLVVEGVGADLLDVDRAPQPAADPDRRDELGEHRGRLGERLVAGLGPDVVDNDHPSLDQRPPDDARLARLRPAALGEHRAAAADRRRLDAVVVAQAHDLAEEVAERAVQLVGRALDDGLGLAHPGQGRAQRAGQQQLAAALLQPLGLAVGVGGRERVGRCRARAVPGAAEAKRSERLGQLGGEHDLAAMTLLLSEQQGAVGLLEQFGRRLQLNPPRDTGRRPRAHRFGQVGQRLAEPLHRAGGYFGRVVLVRVRADDHELVAAVARAEVVGPDGGAQRVTGAAQDLVADEVSVALVDLLELVEVEHHHREALVGARAALDLQPQAFVERGVVETAGQRVGAGGEGEAGRGAGVAARRGGEVAEGLQQAHLLPRRGVRALEPHRQHAAQRAVPVHRYRHHAVGGQRAPLLRDPASEAFTEREAVADRLVAGPVRGFGKEATLFVTEVDGHGVGAGDRARLRADRGEHRGELGVLVDDLGRARECGQLGDAPLALLGEPDLGERPSRRPRERGRKVALLGGERPAARQGEHVAGDVAMTDRREQRVVARAFVRLLDQMLAGGQCVRLEQRRVVDGEERARLALEGGAEGFGRLGRSDFRQQSRNRLDRLARRRHPWFLHSVASQIWALEASTNHIGGSKPRLYTGSSSGEVAEWLKALAC